jgi:hypothetical protein
MNTDNSILVLFMSITFLLPNNPFIKGIKPTITTSIDSSILLTKEDKRKFLTYQENYKVTDPETYSFLGNPIKFIALGLESSKQCTSIVLYVRDRGDLMAKLSFEFGNYYSSFEFTGETKDTLSVGKIAYETFVWKQENWTMMVSPQDSSSRLSERQNFGYSRVWIKKLKNIN